MAKNRWLLMAAALMMAASMSAQFPGGFGNFAQMAKRQAQQKAAEAEKNYQKGNELLEAKKYDKAFAAYEKAANDGHAGAQYNLGTFYIEGKVVPQDYNKAVEWFEKAANQGLKDAQFNLAAMYHQGAGVPKDEQKAEYWARKYKDLPEAKVELTPAAGGNVEEVVFQAPEERAIFKGGDQGLMTYLQQNLHYPQDAMQQGVSGRVFVQFVVNTDGSTSNVKTLNSVFPSLDEEAMRVVKEMPAVWTPAKNDGVPVRMQYTLPITFRLNLSNTSQMSVPETQAAENNKEEAQ